MTPIERAQRYLDKCDAAISGSEGHKTAFAVVCAVVNGFALSDEEAFMALGHWNSRCQPPWTERELRHKIADAQKAQHDKPRGHMLGNSRWQSDGRSYSASARKSPAAAKPAPASYDLEDADELPDAVADGARALIKAVFQQGEGIRIANARLNEEEHEIPDGAGVVLSREEWLRKLDEAAGDPNLIWSNAARTGIYVGVNPMKIGGSKDADVTSFRHALMEFDEGLSLEEQFSLYRKSRLPCSAIIYSGGKSVHAWVRVEAADRGEYDERLAVLYEHFESAGYKFDSKNKNPSRFSRLPNCVRFDRRQELLALNCGAESFSEWMAEIQADGIGKVWTVDELLSFDTSKDENTLLGNRWVCRSGSCIIIAPSGIGKSSATVQAAACWAIGKPFIGISPAKPLKVLIIQAENDMGDLSEMMQGVHEGFGFLSESEERLLRQNLIFIRDTTHTGAEFTNAVRRLIDKHKPDLVVFDPLLSFIGADISRQEVCSEFLRSRLNPIAEATGVAWLCVHHTGKPSTDPRSRKHWQASDYGYSGIGSSELTNWARAIVVIEDAGRGVYRLRFSKRGTRAGATNPDGSPTIIAWMRHAEKGIFWKQIDPPEEVKERSEQKGGKPSKIQQIIGMNLHGFLAECTAVGEGKNVIARRLENFCSKHGIDISESTSKRLIEELASSPCNKLKKTNDRLYIKGPNA